MHPKIYALVNEIINCQGTVMLEKARDVSELQRDYLRLMYYAAANLLETLSEWPDIRAQTPNKLRDLPISDLRPPITRLVGYSRMLLEHPEVFEGKTLSGKARACVEKTYQIGQQLLNYTIDLATYAGLQSGTLHMHLSPFDAASSAYWLGEVYRLLGDDPVSLNIDVAERLPLVYGDEFRTYQIFNSLIDNAIKFTHRGRININLAREQRRLRLRVADTGIGIPPDLNVKIFEPFFQADPQTRGLGLGLHLAKALAALQDSTLEFESVPGQGSTFVFTLRLVE
ncbi:MAG: HAMP domain-containing histidine kinase [Chloroflexi bacterium]|nr:HAMP domain-containing histidine kinase [Chloroflexota bacterium]